MCCEEITRVADPDPFIPLYIYLVLPPRRALLRHLVQKYFFVFALIEKIFLQSLVEIIFKIFLKFLGPRRTTKKKKSENFTHGVLGIKIG